MSLFEDMSEYESYAYSYPHKLAYRSFSEPKHLSDVWEHEDLNHLFLYVHIPYCEMRCGFCNLFTIANPKYGKQSYVDTLIHELQVYQDTLGETQFEAYAIGGGTPTFLSAAALAQLFAAMDQMTNHQLPSLLGSIECSPNTIDAEKLAILKSHGVTRLSMGVQSWLAAETKALGRPQAPEAVTRAVELIKDQGFEVLNLDLIYGTQGQTRQSFLYSIQKTLAYEPEEIFLYPLYIREQTGLGRKKNQYMDERLALYRFGRDYLLEHGYQQISMRCFRKVGVVLPDTQYKATLHNTIGVGAGARSYTSAMNYCTPFAVKMKSVRSIIDDYTQQSVEDLQWVKHGIVLNLQEQKIRFMLKSLVEGGVLHVQDYQSKFGSAPFDDFPQLLMMADNGWLAEQSGVWRLTALGMEKEDAIGPSFYSSQIKQKMQVNIL